VNTTVTLLGAVVVLAIGLVARYGADSRRGDDPTGRDPAWPAAPGRDHTPREDLALLTTWVRRLAAHRRCWALLDRSLRSWERDEEERPVRQ
jgi:hypothetical protein